MIIERRALLRGLFAAPAIVAVSSLMPLRGVLMKPEVFVPRFFLVSAHQGWKALAMRALIEVQPLLRTITIDEDYRAEIDRIIGETVA